MGHERAVSALLLRCALLAGIAALPVAFNAWIDPARILGAPDSERAIAEALIAGHNVTNASNYDDRAIAKWLAASRTSAPDVLALGSSRIQPLPSAAFPGCSFVNAAVAGARLDDILGVYGLYDRVSRRPHRVVLNLDPFTLQEGADGTSWRAVIDEHAAILARIGAPVMPWRDQLESRAATFTKLASPEYFRLAVFSLRHHGPAGIRFAVTDSAQNAEKTKTPDGTLIWSWNPPDKTERQVSEFLATMARDARYPNLAPNSAAERMLLLERFVRYLRGMDQEVTLLLVPFHPLAYEAFAHRADRPLMVAEARYRDLARRTGATHAAINSR